MQSSCKCKTFFNLGHIHHTDWRMQNIIISLKRVIMRIQLVFKEVNWLMIGMASGGWWRHLLLAGVIGDIVTYLAPGVTGESAPANQSSGSGVCWPIIGHLGVRGKGPAAVQWHARDESRDHLRRRDETSDTGRPGANSDLLNTQR